jgi:hypothetical protein
MSTISIAPASVRAQVIENQAFDSASAASAAGWAGFRNGQDGNSFGFRATNLTGGSSPSGEAGGTIARTPNLAYYADLTISGSPNFGYSIHASGELAVTGIGAFNNAIRMGFFNSANTTGVVEFLGFQVAEAQSSSGLLQVFPTIIQSNGAIHQTDATLRVSVGSTYTWLSDWNPGASQMSVQVFDSAGASIGISSLTLGPSDIATGISLNAFGLMTGAIGQADPSNTADLFVDNLTYSFTAVPEPSSLVLVFLGSASVFGLRRRLRVAKKTE